MYKDQDKRIEVYGVESHFVVLCLFLVNCVGGWNHYIWLVSCRGEVMLTQAPAPDGKCKLNISSFIALPHFLDCLVSTTNFVLIVLLL